MKYTQIKQRFTFFLANLITAIFFFSTFSYAQPGIDSATREVDRPIREEVEKETRQVPKKVPIKEEKEEEKEIEGPSFLVKKINLVGCESFPPENFRSILEKHENKKINLEGLKIVAKEIEREYLRKGIIAACFVPPQDIKDGVVTLQVVEAHMGNLKIKDHSFFEKKRLANYWTIKPGEVLRYDKMSRISQLMNKNPDREVQTTLHAGEKPKYTDVLLDVKTHFPAHFTFSFDNEGAPSSGRQRKGLGVRHNNFLFADDVFIYGYSYGTYFSSNYAFHKVPITNFGTTFMYGYTFSRASPKKEYEATGLNSRAENTSFFLYQDVFHKATYLGEIHFGIDAKDKTVLQNTGTTYRDRFRIIRVGGNFVHKGFGGITYLSPELSQGINAFGARGQSDLSSRGVENTFTKFNMGIQHKRPLPLHLQLSLNLKAQIASEKLASQEEFYVGGINSVRGYPSGDFLADTVFQSNVEVLIPAFLIPKELKLPYGEGPLRDDITGLVFFDFAEAIRRGVDTSIPDKGVVSFASVGAGLRIRLFKQALMRLEWGIPTGGERPITERAPSRLHFSISFEDRIFEELERLEKEIAKKQLQDTSWNLINGELKRDKSLLRKALYVYVHLAQNAYQEGNLADAKKYYKNLLDACQSIYQQTLNYVKKCKKQQEELTHYEELARQYNQNYPEKALELWGKIINEAKIKDFILEL